MRDLISITPFLSCYPPDTEPLSADVFVIRGESGLYLFDTGCGERTRAFLDSLPRPRAVILSHFHADHAGNADLPADELIVSGHTRQRLGIGATLQSERVIEDGVSIRIRRCPSVHEKGCLVVSLNGYCTLMGDLWHPRLPLNRSVAIEMLNELRAIDTPYFIGSHESGRMYTKEQVLDRVQAMIRNN